MEKISVAQARQPEAVGKQVKLQGWVRTRRDSKGGFSFLELNDGSCLGNVQVIAESSAAQLRERDPESLAPAPASPSTGEVRASPAKGQADRGAGRRAWSSTAGPTRPPTPCRRRATRSSSCATIAHLRPRTNTFGAVTRVRNCVCTSIHDFFQEQGFLYIQPPIITASDCEGAGQMFRVTTLDLGKPPRNDKGEIDYTQGLLRPAALT